MLLSQVSSQGQTTIPIAIRERLGLTSGKIIIWEIEEIAGGIPTVKISSPTKETLLSLQGSSKGIYGKNKKAIDSYVVNERASWER